MSKIESTLRGLGLENLTDKGLKALNETAQEAVKEATPIFVTAIEEMTFEDSKAILLGDDTAATAYLKTKTQNELYAKFEPIIKTKFKSLGADQIWQSLITSYNQMPFTERVNPNLTDYVTTQALEGVYKMIALEEIEIRSRVERRTSKVLKQVFAIQD